MYVHWSSDDLLDFVRLQESRQVCASHDGLRQVVIALQLGLLAPGAVESIKALEGRLGPDNETADVTTRSKLHQVHLVDRNQINSRDVTESLGQALVLSVNDEWAKFACAATVAHFTLTSTETFGLVNL